MVSVFNGNSAKGQACHVDSRAGLAGIGASRDAEGRSVESEDNSSDSDDYGFGAAQHEENCGVSYLTISRVRWVACRGLELIIHMIFTVRCCS